MSSAEKWPESRPFIGISGSTLTLSYAGRLTLSYDLWDTYPSAGEPLQPAIRARFLPLAGPKLTVDGREGREGEERAPHDHGSCDEKTSRWRQVGA